MRTRGGERSCKAGGYAERWRSVLHGATRTSIVWSTWRRPLGPRIPLSGRGLTTIWATWLVTGRTLNTTIEVEGEEEKRVKPLGCCWGQSCL